MRSVLRCVHLVAPRTYDSSKPIPVCKTPVEVAPLPRPSCIQQRRTPGMMRTTRRSAESRSGGLC
eukprot:12732480-Alexandrium_andersonii.AAC.1